jgi:hypothetical protein
MLLKNLSILLGAMVLSVPAFAQDAAPVQVSGGYSYLTRPNAILVSVITDEPSGTSEDEGGKAPGSGWFGEIVGNITPYAAIVGQVSATYTTGTLNSKGWRGEDTAYAFLGGGRATLRRRVVAPFGQVLLGMVRTDADVTSSSGIARWSNNYYAIAAGGGVDLRAGGNVGVHVAVDMMRTSSGRGGGAYDGTWRMQAGLVVPMR